MKIVVALLMPVLVYLCFWFITLEPSPVVWGVEGRWTYLLVSFGGMLASFTCPLWNDK